MKIYVAGPYTLGDVVLNVRAAVEAASVLADRGHCPFVPHLAHLWHTIAPRSYEDWLRMDNEWLDVCDAVLRIPGDSAGADEEVRRAIRLGIPVYFDLEAVP